MWRSKYKLKNALFSNVELGKTTTSLVAHQFGVANAAEDRRSGASEDLTQSPRNTTGSRGLPAHAKCVPGVSARGIEGRGR